MALRPFGQVATAPELDIHPPVYFWLLHGWLRLMRGAHGMEPALIALNGALRKCVGGCSRRGTTLCPCRGRVEPQGRATAAAVGALSPFWLAESQKRRMYTLGFALS